MKAKGTTLTGGVGAHSSVRGECGGGLGCLRLRVGLGGLGSAQVGPVRLETLFFFLFFSFFFFCFLFSILFLIVLTSFLFSKFL